MRRNRGTRDDGHTLHFKHEVPVTVRFSANSGILKIADVDPRADPKLDG